MDQLVGFCEHCGHHLADRQPFCNRCGARVHRPIYANTARWWRRSSVLIPTIVGMVMVFVLLIVVAFTH